MNPSPSQKLPVELADRLPAYGNLWLLLRAWDSEGRGTVLFTLDDAAAALKVVPRTIQNYIYKCVESGLFISAWPQDEPGLYKVRLSGLGKVCQARGIDKTECVFSMETEDIPNRKLKATEATTALMQKQSEHARYREEQHNQEASI
jgi:hypothetical protein